MRKWYVRMCRSKAMHGGLNGLGRHQLSCHYDSHLEETDACPLRSRLSALLAPQTLKRLGQRYNAEGAEMDAVGGGQVGAQDRALTASKEATDRQLAHAGAQADAVRAQVAELQAAGTIDPQDSQQAIASLQVGLQ